MGKCNYSHIHLRFVTLYNVGYKYHLGTAAIFFSPVTLLWCDILPGTKLQVWAFKKHIPFGNFINDES